MFEDALMNARSRIKRRPSLGLGRVIAPLNIFAVLADSSDVYLFTDASEYGGAERSLMNLVAGLDRRRWRPTLVYHESDALAPLLNAARDLEVGLWAVPPMPEGARGARQALSFAQALRRRGPAVFHAHLSWWRSCKFALAAAALARVPAILATEHAFVDTPATRSTRVQMRAINAAVGRRITVSDYLRHRLVHMFGWAPEQIVVIPNGIRCEDYRVAVDPGLRARLSHAEQRRVILALSRLDPAKGLGVLVEAVAELPDVQLVVAGQGPQHGALRALAEQLGLADRVDLLGHRDDVAQLLACADVYAQPSLNEAFGLGALEAMCAGRPVVATSVGGTPELVEPDRNGLLVPAGDASALAAAIRGVLADPAGAERLVRAGRQTAATFSLQRMADSVMALYEQLLAR